MSSAGEYKTERGGNNGPVTGSGKLTIREGKAFTDKGSSV